MNGIDTKIRPLHKCGKSDCLLLVVNIQKLVANQNKTFLFYNTKVLPQANGTSHKCLKIMWPKLCFYNNFFGHNLVLNRGIFAYL